MNSLTMMGGTACVVDLAQDISTKDAFTLKHCDLRNRGRVQPRQGRKNGTHVWTLRPPGDCLSHQRCRRCYQPPCSSAELSLRRHSGHLHRKFAAGPTNVRFRERGQAEWRDIDRQVWAECADGLATRSVSKNVRSRGLRNTHLEQCVLPWSRTSVEQQPSLASCPRNHYGRTAQNSRATSAALVVLDP